MELRDVLAQRRSIRKYSKRAVSGRKLRRLYKALQLAPSGANKQNYAFIFVTDAEKRRQIAEQAGHQEFLAEAPVIMAAVCEPGGGFNVAIAVDHMVLAATDEGLGTCWWGCFDSGGFPGTSAQTAGRSSLPGLFGSGWGGVGWGRCTWSPGLHGRTGTRSRFRVGCGTSC